jgi:hypothetical protein
VLTAIESWWLKAAQPQPPAKADGTDQTICARSDSLGCSCDETCDETSDETSDGQTIAPAVGWPKGRSAWVCTQRPGVTRVKIAAPNLDVI